MSDDLVRVRYQRGFTDGLAGTAFVDGVSLPISRLRAARIVAGLGNGACVIEPGVEPWPSDLAALPPEPAPNDAPVVSPAHVARPAPSPSPAPLSHRPRR